MAETARELQALAYIVNQLRPGWHRAAIEQALTDDCRDLDILTRAAVQAAKKPATIHPNGIRTTFPGADGCTVCEQRKTQTERAGQPPRVVYCSACSRPLDEGIEHACVPAGRSTKPAWWEEAKAITNRYAQRIKDARDLQDYEQVAELQAERDREVDALLGDQ